MRFEMNFRKNTHLTFRNTCRNVCLFSIVNQTTQNEFALFHIFLLSLTLKCLCLDLAGLQFVCTVLHWLSCNVGSGVNINVLVKFGKTSHWRNGICIAKSYGPLSGLKGKVVFFFSLYVMSLSDRVMLYNGDAIYICIYIMHNTLQLIYLCRTTS